MNIHIASQYLKAGYRIRRSGWEPEEFISECAGMLDKREVFHSGVIDKNGYRDVRSISDRPAFIMLEDLLADDWEIITLNIRKEFNKYGAFEYDDEEDWDNYEPDYSYFED
jgi:hypothetical protein